MITPRIGCKASSVIRADARLTVFRFYRRCVLTASVKRGKQYEWGDVKEE